MFESSYLSKEQNDKINEIDTRLAILLNNMEYEDYLYFLKNDEYMITYDTVLGYCDINYFPEAFLKGLTIDFLNKILVRVNDKIKELGLDK